MVTKRIAKRIFLCSAQADCDSYIKYIIGEHGNTSIKLADCDNTITYWFGGSSYDNDFNKKKFLKLEKIMLRFFEDVREKHNL